MCKVFRLSLNTIFTMHDLLAKAIEIGHSQLVINDKFVNIIDKLTLT